jgi:hypothetical protein
VVLVPVTLTEFALPGKPALHLTFVRGNVLLKSMLSLTALLFRLVSQFPKKRKFNLGYRCGVVCQVEHALGVGLHRLIVLRDKKRFSSQAICSSYRGTYGAG